MFTNTNIAPFVITHNGIVCNTHYVVRNANLHDNIVQIYLDNSDSCYINCADTKILDCDSHIYYVRIFILRIVYWYCLTSVGATCTWQCCRYLHVVFVLNLILLTLLIKLLILTIILFEIFILRTGHCIITYYYCSS
jgi:hypothetical protein